MSERFWSRVEKTDGCWLWTGCRNAQGYGVAWDGQRTILAHRMAWKLAHGAAPADCLCHKCDNPRCVNPGHMFEGSRADNLADMRRKGRGSKPPRRIGAAHHATPLTAQDVLFIRWAAGRGHSKSALGRMFGISATAASNIVNGKTWAHL